MRHTQVGRFQRLHLLLLAAARPAPEHVLLGHPLALAPVGVLEGHVSRMSQEAARRVARDGRVKTVEPDRVVTTAAKPSQTTSPPQTLPTGIQRTGADASSTLAGNGTGSVSVDLP